MEQHQAKMTQRSYRPSTLRLWLLISVCCLLGLAIVVLAWFISITQGVNQALGIFGLIVSIIAALTPLAKLIEFLIKKHTERDISSPSLAPSSQEMHVHAVSSPAQQPELLPAQHAPVATVHLLPAVSPVQQEHHDGPIPFSVPYRRNMFFTGREDYVRHLHAAVLAGKSLGLPHAISGLGGMGKTQTALEYAYRFRDTYEAIFWVRADSRETLVSDIVSIALVLKLPEKDEHDQQRVIEAVKEWLGEHSDWLLILDNVEDQDLVSVVTPALHHGSVLLTARTHILQPLAHPLELEKMSEADSLSLLLRRAGLIARDASCETASEIDLTNARAIVHLLDGLPLALDQAGAYILETGCGSADYLSLYHQRQGVLLQRRGRFASDHPASVTATFSLAFERIEHAHPAAADLLRFCAFLHPDDIPEELVREGAAHLETPFRVFATDAFALNEAIETLRLFSLIRRNASTKTLTIHRLVQDTLKGSMGAETARQWIECTAKAISALFPFPDTVPESVFLRYIPHTLLTATYIEEAHISSREAVQVVRQAGRYQRDHLHFVEAESLLLRARTISEHLFGPQHFETLRCLQSLAKLYEFQGESAKEIPLREQIVEIGEQELTPDHPHYSALGVCLDALAQCYCRQGWYEKAEVPAQRAVTISEEELNLHQTAVPEAYLWRFMLESLLTLAHVRYEQSKETEAEPLLQRALEICQQHVTATPDLSRAKVLSARARFYQHQGKYAEAKTLFQDALALFEQHLVPLHAELAEDVYALAKLYLLQEKYAEAEPLLQRALAIQERQFGPHHPKTVTTLKDYALLLRATRRDGEADLVDARWH